MMKEDTTSSMQDMPYVLINTAIQLLHIYNEASK